MLALAAAVVVAARGAGLALGPRRLALRAAPLYGDWDIQMRPAVLVAVAIAVAVVAVGPRLARRLSWPALVVVTSLAAAAWAVALALPDGVDSLTDGITSRHEYLPLAHDIDDVGAFVDGFTDELRSYPIHVQGHPPGLVALLAVLDPPAPAVAGLFIGGGAVAVGAVLVLVRRSSGDRAARDAAPYLALLPAAMWVATTADALFAGVALLGVALLTRGRVGAAAGGALLGLAVHLSYGAVLAAPLALVAVWRRPRQAAIAAGAGLAVTAAFLTLGFAWWEGLAATHDAYITGVAAHRPHWYGVLAGLAVVVVACGPATVAGLVRRRSPVVLGAAAAIVLALASGLAKGEVERIWLFLFVPLAAAAGAVGPSRRWLAAQAAVALALAVALRTPW